jgi:DNA processing protein
MLQSALDEGMRLTTVLDDDYPLNLRTIFNAPPFLFYRGELRADEDARSVAVVGTRTPSADGLRRAAKMAGLLAQRQVTVLSGMALGIDAAAHEAALDAGARTMAVLGNGLRQLYPRAHAELAERIAANGALVSQFWPDAPPTTYSFPRRNVTMSGMGQGTVVIEASSTSGAKMQARLALEHGKKVFLVRNLVTNQPWAQKYLARGAVEVKDVADIVHRLRAVEDIRTLAQQAHQLGLGLDD